MASHAKSLVPTGWSLRSWRASRTKRKLTPPAGIDSPLIFQDGFGTRWTGLDAESGEMVEILAFHPEFASAPGFAGAVGERVARLARVRHTFYARTRRLDRPSADSLLLFSDRVPGWRLADVLTAIDKERSPIDVGAVLAILRQLIPAVALFSRHQRDAAIGTIGPERLILTPQGRLVVAEYALAPGLETLHYSRDRLWRDVRVALPTSANASRIPPSADVVGMGVVALSLLHARLLTEDEFLFALVDLVATARETTVDERRPLSTGLNHWLSRALQLDERQAFQSPQEAQVAFEEMLAKERGYVTTPGQLDLFVSRVERAVGPPVALPAPPPVPVAAGPTVVSLPQVAPPTQPPEPVVVERRAPVVVQTKPVEVVKPAPASVSAPTAPTTPAAQPREAPLPSSMSGRLRRVSPLAAGLGAVAVIEAGVIAWLLVGGTSARSGQQGDVVIQSRPLAARVTIDGEEKGITPLTTSLSPGAHIVEVRVGRSEPRVIPMDVKQGVQNSVYVELQSVATVGGLDVRTDPGSAKVTVDGRPRGTTPLVLRDLAPGDHDVWLEAGRQKIHQTVRIEAGVTSQLVVPMGR